MTHVIQQPAGSKDAREHYRDTIESPVSMDLLRRFLQPDEIAELQGLYQSGHVPTWGVTPGDKNVNRNRWNRIERGDVVLFSRDGFYHASAVVTIKLHDRDLALELWGTDKTGATWEYIYFVDEVRHHEIPYAEFNRVVDLSAPFVPANAARSGHGKDLG